MAETAGTAGRIVQAGNRTPGHPAAGGDHHLGNPVPPAHREGGVSKVQEDDGHFSAVIGIDGAGAVGQDDAMAQGEAAAGPDLGLKSRRESDADPGGDQNALSRGNFHRFPDGGPQVHARGVFRGVIGQGQVFMAGQSVDGHLERRRGIGTGVMGHGQRSLVQGSGAARPGKPPGCPGKHYDRNKGDG